MDEKAFMMGGFGEARVAVSRYKRAGYITQPGNCEWVSSIECISADGRILSPWVIFKGKEQQKIWFDAMEDGYIALSDNGWTDNVLGLEWLKQCFEPESRRRRRGQYRILIFDGHASNITSTAVDFCSAQKIILLCFPPYLTHLLQPLDVGVFHHLANNYSKHLEDSRR